MCLYNMCIGVCMFVYVCGEAAYWCSHWCHDIRAIITGVSLG